MKNGYYLVKIKGLHFPKIALLDNGIWWYGPIPGFEIEEVIKPLDDGIYDYENRRRKLIDK